MSIHFHPLTVKEIVRETSDAVTVVFHRPNSEEFKFQAGQYLTLKFKLDGKEPRRAYSLCSSPQADKDILAVTVKRVDGGVVSNHVADQLKAGDVVEVLPPMGNFKMETEAGRQHHYVLIGAGSGITPLMSILKTVLLGEPNSKVTLIYGNRNEEQVIFSEGLKQLESQYGDRLRVIHSLSQPGADWQGLQGRLTRHQLLGLFQSTISADKLEKSFWLCGPAGMMAEAEAALGFVGVAKHQIHKENFTAPLPDPTEASHTTVSGGQRGDYTIKVILDGEEHDVEVGEQQSILEAAIDVGVDPPYACQMGVCCTCRALVKSGSVEMDEDEGLSDQEIEEGYVLTCQSHPLTPDVVVEYM